MKTSKIIIFQLILILGSTVFSFQKSTLEAISIKSRKITYDEESNELNIKFQTFAKKGKTDFDKEESKFIINDIKNGCINDIYNFKINGKLVGDIQKFGKSIPKDIKISLKNNLIAICNIDIIDFDEFNLELFCYVVSNNKLNNEDIEFDLSQIEKDEKNNY